MFKPKFRLRKRTSANGRVQYSAQVKTVIFWYNLHRVGSRDGWLIDHEYWYDSLDAAIGGINRYLDRHYTIENIPVDIEILNKEDNSHAT